MVELVRQCAELKQGHSVVTVSLWRNCSRTWAPWLPALPINGEQTVACCSWAKSDDSSLRSLFAIYGLKIGQITADSSGLDDVSVFRRYSWHDQHSLNTILFLSWMKTMQSRPTKSKWATTITCRHWLVFYVALISFCLYSRPKRSLQTLARSKWSSSKR